MVIRLAFREKELLQSNDSSAMKSLGDDILEAVESIQQQFAEPGRLSTRHNVYLNIIKLRVVIAQEDYFEFEEIAKTIFQQIVRCYFDYAIDRNLIDLFYHIRLPKDDLLPILAYLQNSQKRFSDGLAKALILQFLQDNSLLTEGKLFFREISNEKITKFIADLENKDFEGVLPLILEDIKFAVHFSVAAKTFPELRRKIIEGLPSDGTVQKEKLLMLLNYEQGDVDEAFSILKELDLSELNYVECIPALKVAEKKEAWEFVIILLEKLLKFEKDKQHILQIKLRLFTANLHSERFPQAIKISEAILEKADEMILLDDQNKEALLAQTIIAWRRRGQYLQALELLKKHHLLLKTFEAKVTIEAETYLENNDAASALITVTEAIKTLKRPSPEQYGSLFLIFTKIGNLTDLHLTSQDKVEIGSFVRCNNEEQWYFIGDEDGLDAQRIPEMYHSDFLDKKVGEKVISERKYSSEKRERIIEEILPIEKYILWQCHHYAYKLSADRFWNTMELIEVQTNEIGIDTRYLIARLEDPNRQKFFDFYCERNIPIALLAATEGGLTNAVGRITNEDKGFIHFSLGELEDQKEIARLLVSGDQFYIDGTSALVMSESGLLEKIHTFIPGLKVPQSVITLLFDTIDRLRYTPGQVGYINYAKGKINYSTADSPNREVIRKHFEDSINILETTSAGIGLISSATKTDTVLDHEVPANLSDACILAQRDNIAVVTDDFLYLLMREQSTNIEKPKYCSSFALVRVLYEQGKISFEEYLNFFAYLSSYRFKFLPISIDDLEKALFGDGIVITIHAEELRKFNFRLTLSEEYGIPFRAAIGFVGRFLTQLIIDDSLLPEVVLRVFIETVETFPTAQNKRIISRALLGTCVQAINARKYRVILGNSVQNKINLLSQFVLTYDSPGNIILL
jgi:hypothetical protein